MVSASLVTWIQSSWFVVFYVFVTYFAIILLAWVAEHFFDEREK